MAQTNHDSREQLIPPRELTEVTIPGFSGWIFHNADNPYLLKVSDGALAWGGPTHYFTTKREALERLDPHTALFGDDDEE